MSPTAVILLVVGILALQVLIWIPTLRMIRRKTLRMLSDLGHELVASGERVLIRPAPTNYRGATAGSGFPFAKGNGVAALTDRRLIVRRLVGPGIEIPLADITGVRDDKWFLRSYINGRPIVIVKLRNDAELGLLVDDHAAWMTALRDHTGAPAHAPA